MDGTCLDQRSRMTDRTLDVLRKAAKAGITVVPCTGRNLGCIPHRLAAGVLRESKTEDDEKNKDLFRYVITSNGAMVTDVKEKKTLFRALIKKEDALSRKLDLKISLKVMMESSLKNYSFTVLPISSVERPALCIFGKRLLPKIY